MIDPIAHYKLNETSGTLVVDSTNKGNNGTATFDIGGNSVTGKIGNALNFDGQTERINITHNILLAQGSVALWFNKKGVTGDDGSVASTFNADKHSRTRMNVSDMGTVSLFMGSPGSGVTLGSVNDEEWHHQVLCWEETSSTKGNFWGYLDRVKSSISTFTHAQQNHTFSAIASLGSVNDNFNGDIDDVRLYGGILTQNDVDLLYNNGEGTEVRTPSIKVNMLPNKGEYRKTKIGRMLSSSRRLINAGVIQ